VIIAHAGADDLAAVAVVGAVATAIVAWRRWRAQQPFVLAVLLTVALVAVGVGASRVTPSIRQARVRPRSTASIAIVAPVDGATTGRNVRVVVRLRGGHLVAATSRTLPPDQGHVHVLLDGKVLSSAARLSTVVHNVKPGRHVLEAQYVALDHGPFNPPVIAVVSFTVA